MTLLFKLIAERVENEMQVAAATGTTLEQAVYALADQSEDPGAVLLDIIAGFAQHGHAVTSDTPLAQVLKVKG